MLTTHVISLALPLTLLLLGQTLTNAQTPGRIFSESHSGLCMELPNSSLKEGVTFQQKQCNGGDNQMYTFTSVGDSFQIRVLHSRKCLAVAGASTADAAEVVQKSCKSIPSMLWKVTGTGASSNIQVNHSEKCIRVFDDSTAEGAKMIQWPCDGRSSEMWRIEAGLGITIPTPSPVQGPIPNNGQSLWEGPFTTPLIAVGAANLPDGRIIMWEFADTSIFDPVTSASTNVLTATSHNMFCPGTAVLPDGRLMITGGESDSATSFYDPSNNIWSIGPLMNIPRGYHSMTVLSDGSVFTLGGSWSGGLGGKVGELYNFATGQWSKKQNIKAEGSILTADKRGIYRSDNHMWLFLAPNGKLFHAGPARQMHWITTAGNGKVTNSILRSDDNDAMNGNAVMFDVGKILTVGGAADYENSNASNHAYVVNLNGGESGVTVKRVGDMGSPRAFVNSVVLPTGQVIVVGGQVQALIFQDVGSVFSAELWDPVTEQFTLLSSMTVPRNYHSVAILMKDGRVFSAGGGLCYPCSVDHPDVEILTPPYLLNADGSLVTTRPVIISSPSVTSPGNVITVTMATQDPGYTFALVRAAAVTHSVNNDGRRFPLSIMQGNQEFTTFNLIIPSKTVAIPGTYFLFAMSGEKVPSIAVTLVVNIIV